MIVQKLLVNRTQIGESRLAETDWPRLSEGEVLVRIDDFALTANNISYALSGESLGYWRFFPEDAQWGLVPVWGFAEVIESRCDELAIGQRIWGYFPMASHLVMQPGRVGPRSFIDMMAHRGSLPAVYNLYGRTEHDPPELMSIADMRSLLFPLLTTSWLIADYFADNALFGVEQVIIGSASSKTGFGTAYYLRALAPRPRLLTGLTSAANKGFVEALGIFDSVLSYQDIERLDASIPTAYVDMSGDGEILAAVHGYFGDQLRASIGVGATHWEAPREPAPLPGAKPAFFFAPAQIAKREVEWGPGEAMRRAILANIDFVSNLGHVLTVRHHRGADAVASQYQTMVRGQTPPTDGLILSFNNANT